jgi:hypothetical protein
VQKREKLVAKRGTGVKDNTSLKLMKNSEGDPRDTGEISIDALRRKSNSPIKNSTAILMQSKAGTKDQTQAIVGNKKDDSVDMEDEDFSEDSLDDNHKTGPTKN